MFSWGGDATAFSNDTIYPAGRTQIVPSLFRIQRSHGILLANLVDTGEAEMYMYAYYLLMHINCNMLI